MYVHVPFCAYSEYWGLTVCACNCSLSTQIFDETEVLFQDSYLNELLIIADYLSESTVVLGMARKKNGRPYISIANGKLKSLVIYTNK